MSGDRAQIGSREPEFPMEVSYGDFTVSIENSGSRCARAGTWRRFSSAVQGRRVYALRSYSRLARLRCYKRGSPSSLEVLEAECGLFNAQLNYTQTQVNVFRARVNLYKAMGGIWVTDAERMTATMYGTNGGPVTLDACTPAGGEGTVP